MTTYFVEYQCTKHHQRYNGVLEFDSRRFPNDSRIRRFIAEDINQNRVGNLSWMVVGKFEAQQ